MADLDAQVERGAAIVLELMKNAAAANSYPDVIERAQRRVEAASQGLNALAAARDAVRKPQEPGPRS